MSMKAVLQSANGDPEVLYLGDTQQPSLADHEVFIKVDAVSVNRADTLQRKGLYPPPPGVTSVLGLECAGQVTRVGKHVTNVSVGDKVMALLPGGGYAEYVSVHHGSVMPVPEDLSLEEAAAIPEVWLTAYQLLHTTAGIKPGNTVLIHAGGSGVGTAAVQLVKLAGASSFVTAGTENKIKNAIDLGAGGGCNYKTGNWKDEVMKWTDGKGVDIILDCIGGSYFDDNMSCIAVDGVWVVYGLMGGAQVSGPALAGILRKRVSLKGTTLRARTKEYKAELVKNFSKDCLKHFKKSSTSNLKPVMDTVFDIKDVVKAHRLMEENKNTGKIVMKF